MLTSPSWHRALQLVVCYIDIYTKSNLEAEMHTQLYVGLIGVVVYVQYKSLAIRLWNDHIDSMMDKYFFKLLDGQIHNSTKYISLDVMNELDVLFDRLNPCLTNNDVELILCWRNPSIRRRIIYVSYAACMMCNNYINSAHDRKRPFSAARKKRGAASPP